MEKLNLPNEPIRLESDGVFDSAGYPMPSESDPFTEDPLAKFADRLVGGMERLMPAMPLPGPLVFAPPPSEHKVKIFWLPDNLTWEQINEVATEIESMLNAGYSCHIPTVINNYVMMDFSKRKESEEDGKQ